MIDQAAGVFSIGVWPSFALRSEQLGCSSMMRSALLLIWSVLSFSFGAATSAPMVTSVEFGVLRVAELGLLPVSREAGGQRRLYFPTPTARVYAEDGTLLYATASFTVIERMKRTDEALRPMPVEATVTVRSFEDEMKLLGLKDRKVQGPTIVVYETDSCPPCGDLRERLLTAASSAFRRVPRLVVVKLI